MTPNTNTQQALTSVGFQKAALTIPKRVICGIYGPEGSGKTRLAMTFPGPIAYILTDFGGEQTARPFQDQKDIWIYKAETPNPKMVEGSEANVLKYFKEVWSKFRKAHMACLNSGARTIVWDSATEIWQLLRLACFGKLSKVMPHQYDNANSEYAALINEVKNNSACNFVLLHKVKDEYKNDQRTGDKIPSWWSSTPYNMEMTIGLGIDIPKAKDEEVTANSFWAAVDKPHKENAMSKGKVVRGGMINIAPMICAPPLNLIPGSDIKDWM